MQNKSTQKESKALTVRAEAFSLARIGLKGLVAIGIMCLGAGYGIAAYKIFSSLFSAPSNGASGLMLVSFLAGIPLCIGLLVGYVSSRRKLSGATGSAALSVAALAIFIFAAGALLREGTICILLAMPLFLFVAIMGALVGAVAHVVAPRKSQQLLSVALVLPFLIAPVERDASPAARRQVTTQSILIDAPAAVVWRHINFPTNIRPEELEGGLAYLIGMPYPIEARTISGQVGGTRELRWQRGISFQEEITAWTPERHIAWNYRFRPDSFPAGSLDDHIVIGGRYFDLESTSYTLSEEAGRTRLSIEVITRVTTSFNWYADFWARFLVDDTAKTILKFYKNRSESDGATPMSEAHVRH